MMMVVRICMLVLVYVTMTHLVDVTFGLFEVARGKKTGGDYYDHEKAVDGSSTTYAYLGQWWSVALGGTYQIHNVHIYLKDRYRFRSILFIQVSNTSGTNYSLSNAVCAAVVISPEVVLNSTISCQQPTVGKQLIIKRKSRIRLELYMYEVKVYADCPNGTFGSRCEVTCPPNCLGNCQRESGECTQCVLGYHGSYCQLPCADNCLSCHQINATCDECTSSFYGRLCSKKCSKQCRYKCHMDTGTCENCVNNVYGDNCQRPCPEHCQTRSVCDKSTAVCKPSCDRKSGICASCVSGFYGENCSKSCPVNCQQKPTCLELNDTCKSSCHQATGDCACINCGGNGACDKRTGWCHTCRPGCEGSQCDTCSDSSLVDKVSDGSMTNIQQFGQHQLILLYILLILLIAIIFVSIASLMLLWSKRISPITKRVKRKEQEEMQLPPVDQLPYETLHIDQMTQGPTSRSVGPTSRSIGPTSRNVVAPENPVVHQSSHAEPPIYNNL